MEHGLAGESVASLMWLLIAVMGVAVVTKYVRIPYTVALVVAGLAIALSPIKLSVSLTPDIILFIFLPALLFEAAYQLDFAEFRDNLRPISLLAVPGVLLTAVFLALIMRYAAGLDWPTAFLFGAIMSATDPVSVVATFRELGAPRRLSVILEGESLFNDGTSLVLFRIIGGIVVAGTEASNSLLAGVGQFVYVVAGGLILGAAIGFGVSFLLARVDDYLVETTMTLVVAYGTYLVAEEVGVSGVIAVVTAGLIFGTYTRHASMSATTRAAVNSTWELFGFLANSLIFLLIGLELHRENIGDFVVPSILAIAAVLVVRLVVVLMSSWVLRFIHRPIPYRWQGVLMWGGLRGSLALAMALSLPFTVGANVPFADRDLLQVTTFGVILFSLLVQGLTIAPLLRALKIVPAPPAAQEAAEPG